MKPKFYELLQSCIDTGLTLGYNRAHKHVSDPDEQHIKQCMFDAVMNELHEWFDFEDTHEDRF